MEILLKVMKWIWNHFERNMSSLLESLHAMEPVIELKNDKHNDCESLKVTTIYKTTMLKKASSTIIM